MYARTYGLTAGATKCWDLQGTLWHHGVPICQTWQLLAARESFLAAFGAAGALRAPRNVLSSDAGSPGEGREQPPGAPLATSAHRQCGAARVAQDANEFVT